jgi:hypothetical protein
MTSLPILDDGNPGLFAGLLLVVIFSLLGLQWIVTTSKSRVLASMEIQLFLAAVSVRFAASVALYLFGIAVIVGDEDASGWVNGIGFYNEWIGRGYSVIDLPSLLLQGYSSSSGAGDSYIGYHYLLAGLFLVTDIPARLSAAALSNLCGGLTVVLIYRTCSLLFSDWVAVRTAWMICLLPSMILWGAQTIKEPVVLFLEVATLYGCVRLQHARFTPGIVAAIALPLLALVPLRFYVVYVLGGALLVAFLLSYARSRKTKLGAALAVVTCVVPVLVSSGVLARDRAMLAKYDLKRIQLIREYDYHTSGSGVRWNYDMSTREGQTMSVVNGVADFFLAPLPWHMSGGSFRMLVTLPEALTWWALIVWGLWPGLKHLVRQRFEHVQILVLFTVGMSLVYGSTFYNIGLAYRQRSQVVPWIVMFALVGLEQRLLRTRNAKAMVPTVARSFA